MNLLITLPVGIVFIMVSYLLIARVYKGSAYALGGIFALVVAMVYSMLAAIFWPGADVFAIHIALYLLSVYGMTIVASQRQKKLKHENSKLHWAPTTLFVFFGIILVTDSVLIFLAQSGMSPEWASRILPEPRGKGSVRSVFPGTVSHDFREKSDQFNEYKKKHEQQATLGWVIKIGWKDEAYTDVKNTLYVEIKTRDGSSLNDAEVVSRFLYPADTKFDQSLLLMREGNGLYSTDVTLVKPGAWDMILNIQHETGLHEMRTKTTIQHAQ